MTTANPHPTSLESPSLLVDAARADELRQAALSFPSLTLTQRQLCDLELLINGGFAPLSGFMDRASYESVLARGQLPDGQLWPIPIVLDVDAAFAGKLTLGQTIALRDPEGFMPAVLTVEEVWEPEKAREASLVYGTESRDHPGVRYLFERVRTHYVAGRLEAIQPLVHHDFENLWNSPEELQRLFSKMGWRKVLAFQTANPIHQLQRRLIVDAAKAHQAHILIHPIVGETRPGDLNYYARVRCYKRVQRHLPHDMHALSLLPLAMRMAGPREAIWHALVNRNHGCTHLLVGPDHGSPPPAAAGHRFYAPLAAQQALAEAGDALGIAVVAVPEHRYWPARQGFFPIGATPGDNEESIALNESDLRTLLRHNREVPSWFSYPEVIEELRQVYPPRHRQGITLFFTGLSGSGKSTLANIIYAKLVEAGGRPVSVLDGDVVRQHLSSELGFSKAHRDINIRRIGFVASEVTKNGGIAICAPIAPYQETRRAVREMIEAHGAFIEIHVSTPLEVCEGRDRKGLYAKARQGLIPEFTGISDPYEVPERPELRIDTSELSPTEAAQQVLLHLFSEGYLDGD